MQNTAKIGDLSALYDDIGVISIDWQNYAPSAPKPAIFRQFSTALNLYSGIGDPITLQAAFEGIKNGRWREPVERIRSATGSDYDKLKKGLFAIYASVLMRGSNKAVSSIDEYTGILVVDVDGKDNAPDLLAWAPKALRGDQWVLGYHRSCGDIS